MLVKFCPLMFDCSCMKPSETFPDECLFTRLDPPVKYRTRGIWRGGFVSWSANKRRSAAPVITFCSPTCPHSLCSYQHTRTQLHTDTQQSLTHVSPQSTSFPSVAFSFPWSKFNTHPHPCTHRHTRSPWSLSWDLVKAHGRGHPELCQQLGWDTGRLRTRRSCEAL